MARCRETGGKPWPCDVGCEALPASGSGNERVVLTWADRTELKAQKAENTYDENPLTEHGAIGVCAACFAVLDEGEITEVTMRGSGVDYWVGRRRAVLEVSGIRRGTDADLARRHGEKLEQLSQSPLHRKKGHPGYVFVILFERRRARFSYHR